ncbi:hypothetical protein [Fulvivirga sp.]|uniref:hypothetical protein n=1 Tax=Fulvivirga sp. TaxID=1931237 RepID=UPI0032EE1A49
MRLILLSIFLQSFYLIGFSQNERFNFDASKDSVVVRITISGHYFSSVIYDFKLSSNNKLSLNSGYISSRTDSLHLVKIETSRNIDYIWKDLIYNNLLILPDQSEVEVIINNNGKPYPMPKEPYQKIYDNMRGMFFNIEVLLNNYYRNYSFIDSDTFYKFIEKGIYSSPDIVRMHNIANTIFTELQFKELRKELISDILEKTGDDG